MKGPPSRAAMYKKDENATTPMHKVSVLYRQRPSAGMLVKTKLCRPSVVSLLLFGWQVAQKFEDDQKRATGRPQVASTYGNTDRSKQLVSSQFERHGNLSADRRTKQPPRRQIKKKKSVFDVGFPRRRRRRGRIYLASKYPFLIFPHTNQWRMLWDVVLAMFLLYVALFLPLNLVCRHSFFAPASRPPTRRGHTEQERGAQGQE